MDSPAIANVTECKPSVTFDNFLHGAILPAVLIILVLAFLNRRKYKPECCNGRPGIVVPLNFLDGYNNRWAYAVAFGAATNSIVLLFYRGFTGGLAGVDSPTWAAVFLFLVQAMEVTVDYYPFFACLTTPYKLVGSILGFCLTLIWLVIVLITLFECPGVSDSYIVIRLDVPYERLILQWPAAACLFALAFKFILIFWKAVRDRHFVLKERFPVAFPHQITYVRCLFQRSGDTVAQKRGKTLWERYRYRPIPGFVYPTRLICVLTVIVILLYQVGFAFFFGLGRAYNQLVDEIKSWQHELVDNIESLQHNFSESRIELWKELLKEFLTVVIISTVWLYIVVIVSLLLGVGYLYLIFRKYRLHMLKLYRGERKFLHSEEFHSPPLMAGSIRWAGYQIAYMAWGLIVCCVVLLVVGLIIISMVCFGKGQFILWILQALVIPLVVSILVYISQGILSRFTFLQGKIKPTDKELPLAIDNRQVYENVAYLMFGINISIGAFSSILRLLLSLVIGLVTLGRIDRSPLQRGYERWDRGLQSYMGMLLVDYSHNHPVMRVFCMILTDLVRSPDNSSADLRGVAGNSLQMEGPGIRPAKTSLARKRWYVAYMLIKNPQLIQHRKGRLVTPDLDDIDIELPDKSPISKYREHLRDWIRSKKSPTDADADIPTNPSC